MNYFFFFTNNLIPLTGKLSMFLLTELKSLVFDDCRKEEEWKVQFCDIFCSNVRIGCSSNLYH